MTSDLLIQKLHFAQELRDVTKSLLEVLDQYENSDEIPNLSKYIIKRDVFIKLLKKLDLELTTSGYQDASDNSEKKIKDEIRGILVEISNLDEKAIEKINKQTEQTHQELLQSLKSRNTISKFKSNWVAHSGEELDKTL
jgi:hypothetical protein